MTITIKLSGEHGELEYGAFPDGAGSGVVAMNRAYGERPFVRIHSSCVFSEAFHTTDCDCSKQLDAALSHVKEKGGVVIYLFQEGRGVGLVEKIRAIAIERERNCDTAKAFAELGYQADPRTYDAAIRILKELGITKLTLATDNPNKIAALETAGFDVERTTLRFKTTDVIDAYVAQKRRVLGHHG